MLPIWRTLFDVVDRSPAGRNQRGVKVRAGHMLATPDHMECCLVWVLHVLHNTNQ